MKWKNVGKFLHAMENHKAPNYEYQFVIVKTSNKLFNIRA